MTNILVKHIKKVYSNYTLELLNTRTIQKLVEEFVQSLMDDKLYTGDYYLHEETGIPLLMFDTNVSAEYELEKVNEKYLKIYLQDYDVLVNFDFKNNNILISKIKE